MTETQLSALRLKAFRQTCARIPADLLLRYVQSSVADPAEFFAFKRVMAQQLGLASFLCSVLSIGNRSPHRVLLARDCGQVGEGRAGLGCGRGVARAAGCWFDQMDGLLSLKQNSKAAAACPVLKF